MGEIDGVFWTDGAHGAVLGIGNWRRPELPALMLVQGQPRAAKHGYAGRVVDVAICARKRRIR